MRAYVFLLFCTLAVMTIICSLPKGEKTETRPGFVGGEYRLATFTPEKGP